MMANWVLWLTLSLSQVSSLQRSHEHSSLCSGKDKMFQVWFILKQLVQAAHLFRR